MKQLVFALLGAFLLSTVIAGQQVKNPTFAAYRATVEKKTATAIDFRRSPGAGSFRTRLREALKGEVNFAGRYILTGWGCGTGCSHGAIIDARTGRVHFPDELMGVGGYDGADGETFTYRKNSRLLVIRGVPGPDVENAPERKPGIYYFEWRANRFRLIKFVPDKDSPNA